MNFSPAGILGNFFVCLIGHIEELKTAEITSVAICERYCSIMPVPLGKQPVFSYSIPFCIRKRLHQLLLKNKFPISAIRMTPR